MCARDYLPLEALKVNHIGDRGGERSFYWSAHFFLFNNIKMANGSVDPNFARWFGRAVVLAARTAEHPTIAFKRQLAENSLRKNQEASDCFRTLVVIVPYELFLLSTRCLITVMFYLPSVIAILFFLFFYLLLPVIIMMPMFFVACQYKENSEMCTARNVTFQISNNGTLISYVVTSEILHAIDSGFYVLGALLFPNSHWLCDMFSKYYGS